MTGRHRAADGRPALVLINGRYAARVSGEQLAAFHSRPGEHTRRRIQAIQPQATPGQARKAAGS
ncbi:MAG: hypothetical protein L0I76_16215 [Pseudonocardia sp.]|nr:hypothetical protein [Pseudonocardia sp.]